MGNHSKCGKCGELDEYCACIPASTAATQPEQASIKHEVLSGDDGAWYEVAKEQYDRANPRYRRTVAAASEQPTICAPNCFYGDCPPCVAAGLRPGAASEQQAEVSDRALAGRIVSVDVSTGDDDAGNRIFAALDGDTGSDGTTLLAIETSRNFGSTTITSGAASGQQAGVDERKDFENWSLQNYRHTEVYSQRDYDMGLEAWQAALTHRATTAPSKDVQTTSKTAADQQDAAQAQAGADAALLNFLDEWVASNAATGNSISFQFERNQSARDWLAAMAAPATSGGENG